MTPEGERCCRACGEEPQWVKNARADGGHATLRHGRRRTDVLLQEVPRERRAAVLQTWYATTRLSSPPRRHFGLEGHGTLADFERLAASHAVYRCVALS